MLRTKYTPNTWNPHITSWKQSSALKVNELNSHHLIDALKTDSFQFNEAAFPKETKTKSKLRQNFQSPTLIYH